MRAPRATPSWQTLDSASNAATRSSIGAVMVVASRAVVPCAAWQRATAAAGFWGLLSGTVAAMINYFWIYKQHIIEIPSDQGANFVSSMVAFGVGAVVMVAVSLFTKAKPAESLAGLVYGTRSPGMEEPAAEGDDAWYRRPALLGWSAVIVAALCYIPFSF